MSGATEMAPAMLEVQQDGKIMHQQSDPFVRTMFSEEVEHELLKNGCSSEAEFCHLFRQWHEAEDTAGISAKDRCGRSLRFREWFMSDYNFGKFPPPTMYVKGIPRVTFEGLVCSIDAHILLYAMVKGGTYNWRSVSTLVAENFMGELAERSQNNHGVLSGKSLPADMRKIPELHCMRLNPNRVFQMKTFKSRAYEVPQDLTANDDGSTIDETGLTDQCQTTTDSLTSINVQHRQNTCSAVNNRIPSIVTVRDQVFDERQGAKRAKHGRLSKWNDQPKGVQPVRYHYRVDETKILPSLRFGIPLEVLEDSLS